MTENKCPNFIETYQVFQYAYAPRKNCGPPRILRRRAPMNNNILVERNRKRAEEKVEPDRESKHTNKGAKVP